MKEIFSTLAICVLLLIVVINLAPALSDLQTINRAREITDNAKDKDITKTTKEISDLLVDTTEDEVWSLLWAPILGLILEGLTALFLFLRNHS